MTMRVTVWNEHRQERVRRAGPIGLPGRDPRRHRRGACAGRARRADGDPRRARPRPDRRGPRRDRRADLVGPRGPRRGRRRDRRPRPGAGPRRDGPHRAPLGPLLEDLQAPDGHDLRPQMARGGRARAALGRRSGPSDRRGAGRIVRPRPTRRCTASTSTSRRPTASSSSAGSRAARCSAAAAATSAAGVASSTSGPGHETLPDLSPAARPAGHRQCGALGGRPAGAAPTFGHREPLEPLA